MATLTLNLHVTDVDGNLVVDPAVFVRLASTSTEQTSVARVALSGRALPIRFDDAPSGSDLVLRVTPSRYHDGAVLVSVDGDGNVRPGRELRLPRRASEWVPVFTAWQELSATFEGLQAVLGRSPLFRLGRTSAPELLIAARYDRIDPADESRVLAKLCLLNLYARLAQETIPGTTRAWFELVDELLMATRERFVAEVDERCWVSVRALAEHGRDGYKKSPVGDHKKNFEGLPGVAGLREFASVKTAHTKANLQFTVARGTRNGQAAFFLDTDLDENGRLLGHTFDLIKHAFKGGTHPLDIHESLRALFPDLQVGYRVEPRLQVPDVQVRVVTPAPEPPLDLAGLAPISQIALAGDSVPWGQGLLNAQKMHSIVAGALGSVGPVPGIRLVAHSGATIGMGVTLHRPLLDGEVPKAHPTILQQVADYPESDARAVDLVIVNGGINDVDIRFILNPFTEAADLEDTTTRACGADLLVLLRAVAVRFSNAHVAVLTYYPILSRLSRLTWGPDFLTAAGAPPPPVASISDQGFTPIWDRIVDNCRIFHVVSTHAIDAAVATANTETGDRRFLLIDPGFTEENAALAPDPWLFGVNRDLSPQDPMAEQRRQACDLFEPDLIRRAGCYRASAGHPNAAGARMYARAILRALAGAAVPAPR